MFHSRDSPRLLVCDTGLYLEQNDIGFITVAICGGYISKYPRLITVTVLLTVYPMYLCIVWLFEMLPHFSKRLLIAIPFILELIEAIKCRPHQ